jgi:hypothetical protein
METACNQWKHLPPPIPNATKVPFAYCLLKLVTFGTPGFIYARTLPKYVLTGFIAIHTTFFALHYQWKHTFGHWK